MYGSKPVFIITSKDISLFKTIYKQTLSPVATFVALACPDSVNNSIKSNALTSDIAVHRAKPPTNGNALITRDSIRVIASYAGHRIISAVVNTTDRIIISPAGATALNAQPSNANLSDLTINSGELSPSFSSDYTNYTSSVNIVKESHTVYTMGDSITGLDVYPPILDSLLNYVFTFVNFGIKGDFTSNMVNRFQPIVNASPDYVIILGGTNDIGAINSTALQVENNLQAMYTLAHNAGIKVIALTITLFKGDINWTSIQADCA